MKKDLKFMFLAVALILAAGCSKEADNCDPNDENSPCFEGGFNSGKLLLTKSEVVGKNVTHYVYDNLNRIIRITNTEGMSQDLSYNGKGQLSKMVVKMNGDVVLETTNLYASGDKPTGTLSVSPLFDSELHSTITYTSHSVTTLQWSSDEPEAVIETQYLFDDNRNLIGMIASHNGEEVEWADMSDFDDKHTPTAHSSPTSYLNSMNNHRRVQGHHKVGGARDYTWEYTYNKQGYPIKAVSYETGSSAVHETYLYTYKVAK